MLCGVGRPPNTAGRPTRVLQCFVNTGSADASPQLDSGDVVAGDKLLSNTAGPSTPVYTVEDFVACNGMDNLEPTAIELRRLFGGDATYLNEDGTANDAISALLLGPRGAIESLCNMLNNTAIVCALLLSWAMPLLMELPGPVAALDSHDPRRVLFIIGFTGSSVGCVINVIFAVM